MCLARSGELYYGPKLAQSQFYSKKIPCVPKNLNPAKNLPTEDFWGILKAKVYENNWSAKNIDQLKKKNLKNANKK